MTNEREALFCLYTKGNSDTNEISILFLLGYRQVIKYYRYYC